MISCLIFLGHARLAEGWAHSLSVRHARGTSACSLANGVDNPESRV
jgi:hypothetical protein